MSGSRCLRSELDSCNRARTVERVKRSKTKSSARPKLVDAILLYVKLKDCRNFTSVVRADD